MLHPVSGLLAAPLTVYCLPAAQVSWLELPTTQLASRRCRWLHLLLRPVTSSHQPGCLSLVLTPHVTLCQQFSLVVSQAPALLKLKLPSLVSLFEAGEYFEVVSVLKTRFL